MLGRLVLLFLVTPAIELGLLIQVDRLIGFWPTIGLIIATGIVGSFLARREGVSTWNRLNQRLQSGSLPGKELVDGVIILVAGALLVTPGVLTDVIGFLGLLPPSRALIRRSLIKRLKRKLREGSMQIQFGIFGGGPSSRPPSSREGGPSASDEDARWKGDSHQIPRYANGFPDADSNDDSDPSSSTSS